MGTKSFGLAALPFFLLSMTLMVSTGCKQDGTTTNTTPLSATPTPTPTPVPTATPVPTPTPTPTPIPDIGNTCSAPQTVAVFKGERSTAAGAGVRGAWSDIAFIPGTTSPAKAYIDAGCTCVKFSFWDGDEWKTETISGANATSYTNLRLAYLSTGIPIVVWSNSTTTLQMAIRSTASLSASSTWSITNLDTVGTGIRAVELKVNPADQVAILYARATASSSHLILCTTGCASGSNYSAPSVTLGTVGTTPMSLGLGWCSTGSAYYPVVALSGAVNSGFGICRQGTLSNCLNGIANWAGGAIQTLTGSGANRPSLALAMDDSVADAPIRVVHGNGTNLIAAESAFAGGGCQAGTIGAIAAGTAIAGTTATSGNGYLDLEKNAGAYHLVANEGIASVRYYNNLGTFATAWNASGVVSPASVALAAAGSTRGGLAVNSSLGQAYTTYASTAATGPFNGNLTMAWVNDITIASNSVSQFFYSTAEFLDGQIQTLTNQVPNLSASATSAGTPAAVFVDYSSGASTTGVLKYAYRDGSTSSSAWLVRTVPFVSQPQAVSLAFDSTNNPWIGVYDQSTLRYYLLTNSQSDGSGNWSTATFPMTGGAVAAATAPAYNGISIAMDKSVTPNRPVLIAGVSGNGTLARTGVWSGRFNPSTRVWGSVSQIESTNLANSVSNVTSDFDATGNIVVSYYDRSAQNRVEYSQSLNGGQTWSASNAVHGTLTAAGQGLKIKLHPVTSRPAVTYYDRLNNRVYYSYCSTAIASCGTVGSWITPSASQLVDVSAGVSTLAAASDGLLSTGLTFTNTGIAYVAYPSGSGFTGSLSLNSNASGAFNGLGSILVQGRNADLISNTTVSGINFAQPGWNVDSVRTSTGALHSAYVGANNWMYVTSCE